MLPCDSAAWGIRMRTVKAVLIVCASLGLCACEMAPVSQDSYGEEYVAPEKTPAHGLADPRFYMDQDNPAMQKMLSHYLQ